MGTSLDRVRGCGYLDVADRASFMAKFIKAAKEPAKAGMGGLRGEFAFMVAPTLRMRATWTWATPTLRYARSTRTGPTTLLHSVLVLC